MAKNDKILFEIKEHVGVISDNQNGWDKELNIISWNGQSTPKFDIRAWNEDHTHMARGITLYSDEMQALVQLYSDWKRRSSGKDEKYILKGKKAKGSEKKGDGASDGDVPFMPLENKGGKGNMANVN